MLGFIAASFGALVFGLAASILHALGYLDAIAPFSALFAIGATVLLWVLAQGFASGRVWVANRATPASRGAEPVTFWVGTVSNALVIVAFYVVSLVLSCR